MIKICHIISGDLWAGAEILAYNLLYYLSKKKDVIVEAVLLNHGILEEELKKLGITVYVFDEKNMSFLNILHKTRMILKKEKPEILHSHRYKENILSYLSTINTNLRKEVKIISTQHGLPDGISLMEKNKKTTSSKFIEIHGDDDSPKNRTRRISIHNINNYVLSHYFDCTVSVSKEIRDILIEKMKYDGRKTICIHNGIVMPPSTREEKRGNIFKIGSAARFFPVKDFSLFVDIARLLIGKKSNLRFVIVGDGPEREKIIKLVEKYNINKYFTFPGFKRGLSDFYEDLDLYMNTSKHEGIPMSVLEAMAHGIPVVAPNVGGLREMIENGVDGFLVDSRKPEEYVNICLKLIESQDLRERLSIAAREKIEIYFSAEKMADSYFNLYTQLQNNQQYF